MIKTTVNDIDQPKNNKFPRLMTYSDEPDLIILMTGINMGYYVGTVINNTDPSANGVHSMNWLSKNLIDFNGSITLSNEV